MAMNRRTFNASMIALGLGMTLPGGVRAAGRTRSSQWCVRVGEWAAIAFRMGPEWHPKTYERATFEGIDRALEWLHSRLLCREKKKNLSQIDDS